MENLMVTITDTLQNKLKRLVSFLTQVHKGFDAIAEEIDNTNLKTAIQALAFESKQYAKEISNQLQQFNIPLPADYTDQMWKEIEIEISLTDEECSLAKGGEITALCQTCEMHFNRLYEEALQEFFPLKNLKDIITYQLYATQCAFMKIKLLNMLRFNHQ